MALNVRPILSSIPAFDANFSKDEAPVFKFTWKNSALARKNKLKIVDNDGNIVYEHTITTGALQHKLYKSDNPDEWKLKNGEVYKATLIVYVDDKGEIASEESEAINIYCFTKPTFKFTNFTGDFADGSAIVANRFINLLVEYNQVQEEGETLESYKFELYESNKLLYESKMKYNSSSNVNVVVGHTIGGVDESKKDQFGNLDSDKPYEIVCIGQTAHGIIVEARQRFFIQIPPNGVGSLITAENKGDGTVVIKSNFIILNAKCSTENPVYILDENGNPYAVDLTQGDYIEYSLEGRLMQRPYELIVDGEFLPGQLVVLRNVGSKIEGTEEYQYKYGYVFLKKIEYTNFPFYYFSFYITEGDVTYEIRTQYFRYESDLVKATLDVSYNENGYYNIQARIDYGDDNFVILDTEKGDVSLTFIDVSEFIYNDGNVKIDKDNISFTYNEEQGIVKLI